MRASDIADYVRWFTVEREWQNWDAPWEKQDADPEAQRKRWTDYYASAANRTATACPWHLELDWNGRHIGWVSAYCIDENYEWVAAPTDGQPPRRAIGIGICEPDLWGNGIGTNALRAYMDLCFENGMEKLYIQTWSGNTRMLRCAEKLGFIECDRCVGEVEFDGQSYDGLTLRVGRFL